MKNITPQNSLLLFPYNGNAREAFDCLDHTYTFLGFIDDLTLKQGNIREGVTIYSRSALNLFPEAKLLAVPGSPTTFRQRREIIESLNIPFSRYATVIHPSAKIAPSAKIGLNTLIMAGVVITADVTIGNHVCILPNTVIHHDSIIEDSVLIGAGVIVAGHVRIRENCYIGSGSTIINNIEIGPKALVGMSSNVLKTVPAEVTVFGNPARISRSNGK
jgi:sugar O-acyltransferase (sialic acid O-acetyltransferase NeuD family)